MTSAAPTDGFVHFPSNSACAALLAGTPAPPSGHTPYSQSWSPVTSTSARNKDKSCYCLWGHLSPLSFPSLKPHMLPHVTQADPVSFSLPQTPHTSPPSAHNRQRMGLEAQARKPGASSLTTGPTGPSVAPSSLKMGSEGLHSSHGPVVLSFVPLMSLCIPASLVLGSLKLEASGLPVIPRRLTSCPVAVLWLRWCGAVPLEPRLTFLPTPDILLSTAACPSVSPYSPEASLQSIKDLLHLLRPGVQTERALAQCTVSLGGLGGQP